MSYLLSCLILSLICVVSCQQGSQQEFINQLRTQGFTDDQISGLFQQQAAQQQRQQQQQAAQQQQQRQQQQQFQQTPQQQQQFQQIPQQQQQFQQIPQQQQQFQQIPQQQQQFQQVPQQQFQQVPQQQFQNPQQQQQIQRQQQSQQQQFSQVSQQQPQQLQTQQQQTQEPPARSKVVFSIDVDGQDYGTITMELFDEVVPITVRNFVAISAGQNPQGFSYKGSTFHRIIPGFVLQGGDFDKFDGTGGQSIYGRTFPDENFLVNHKSPGLLSMANAGPDTNGSQFFITTAKELPHLDGKHTVFGRVDDQESFNVVKRIEALGTKDGTPTKTVTIVDSRVIQVGCSVNNDPRCKGE